MPPSAPADLTRAYLRRAINLHRFGNGLAQRTVAVLERARDDIVARLAKLPPTANARARLEQLYAQVTETIRSAYSDIHVLTSEQLAGMAQSQAAFTTASLNATLKGAGAGAVVQSVAVGETMLASIVETNPVRGALMADWWGKQAGDVAFKFRQQIQLGMAQSETVEQLIQRVRGQWAGGGYVGGVLSFKSQATRQAESLVRTAVAEVANRAQFETLRANDDITSTWQFVATLASNTCEECMALDGTVWAYDDPKAPEPPLHFSCRCVPVAVVDWEKLGIEPPAEGTRAAVDPTTGEGTVVPASTTYDDWLRAQPAEVQADILGAGKAELFSEGKITLRDLVRSDGSVVSLQQLQAQVAELAGAPPTPDVAPIREQFADVHPQTIGARLDTPLEVARGQEAAAAWAAQVTAAVQAQAAGAEAGVAKYGKASTAAKKAAATKATNKAMDAALAQAPTFAKIAPQQVAWLEDALAKGASIEQAILGYGIANPNAILLDDIAAWAKAYYGYGIPPGGALTPTIAKAAAPALTPAQKAAATKAAKKAAAAPAPPAPAAPAPTEPGGIWGPQSLAEMDVAASRMEMWLTQGANVARVEHYLAKGALLPGVRAQLEAELGAGTIPGQFWTWAEKAYAKGLPVSTIQEVAQTPLPKVPGATADQVHSFENLLLKRMEKGQSLQDAVNGLKSTHLNNAPVEMWGHLRRWYEKRLALLALQDAGYTMPASAILGSKAAPAMEAFVPSPLLSAPATPAVRDVFAAKPRAFAGFRDEPATVSMREEFTAAQLNRTQSVAFREYQGSGYGQINASLRGIMTGSPDALRKIKAMESAMRPIERDYLLYRGIGPADPIWKAWQAGKIEDFVGGRYRDPGFVSTTTHVGKAEQFAHAISFEIEVPKATPGMWMETATGRTAYEYEFVIQHHAEFEIVSYGPGSLGSMVVRLRYIGRWEP